MTNTPPSKDTKEELERIFLRGEHEGLSWIKAEPLIDKAIATTRQEAISTHSLSILKALEERIEAERKVINPNKVLKQYAVGHVDGFHEALDTSKAIAKELLTNE